MAGAKFQYDEQGGTFFYFLFSFQLLVLVPCTYYFWPRSSKDDEVKRDKGQCHCDDCAIKSSRLRSREPAKQIKKKLIKIAIILGWILLTITGYKVINTQHDHVDWDPFKILEIDPGASLSEIKKAYRSLSLIYHPDMATGDATMFMKIAKAHAALTDDESRKNWETYGNPDGPGATSFGIALPSWIIEKENAVWVLGVYALIFMVFLPVAVGVWWYRSVKFGGDQVLLATSQIYFAFLHKTPYMVLKRVLMVLAASYEFDKAHNSKIVERPSDNIEIPQLMKELPNLGEKNRENPLGCSYSIKARALLHAHLTRLKLPPNTLEEDKMYVLKKCPYLLQDFVQRASQMITLALNGRLARMPNLETMENAMKLCPMIVQALWDNKSPLLQLPNITEDLLRHFTNRKRNIRSLKHLAMMKSSDRRAMLRSLSDSQYSDVMTVLANMPLIELDVRSEVLDDEDSGTITAGAIVTVTVTLVRKTLSTLFDKSDDKALDNTEEPAAAEEAEQLANGGGEHSPNQARKPKVWEKAPKKKKGKPKKKAGGGGGGHKPAQQAAKKQPQPANNVAASAATAAAKKPSEAPADAPSQQNKENPPAKEKEEASEESSSGSEQSEAEEDDWEELHQQVGRKEKVLETKSKISHSVHCPHFPEDKQEYWWIYIADHKRKLLMTAPYLITNLVDQEEVELKFTAPSKLGIVSYSVIVRSDSYLDLDVFKVIKLDVKEPKEMLVVVPQWELSEEEDDRNQEESAVEDSDLATDDDDDD